MTRHLPLAAALLLLPLLTTPALADRDWHDHGGGWEHHEHHDFFGRDFRFFTPFEFQLWRGGYWVHDWHAGRFGWWWVADGYWYWYPEPVYPYPTYVPAAPPPVIVAPPPPAPAPASPTASGPPNSGIIVGNQSPIIPMCRAAPGRGGRCRCNRSREPRGGFAGLMPYNRHILERTIGSRRMG